MEKIKLLHRNALEVLKEIESYFSNSKKLESPRLLAEILLAEILHVPRLEIILHNSRILCPQEIKKLEEWIEKKLNSLPVQYILGSTHFCGMKIKVTPEVLIPRPETELLVDTLLKLLSEKQTVSEKPLPIVDVGTGSGCIAIALAKECPHRSVIGVDISEEALKIAQENAAALPNLTFLKSDLLENFKIKKAAAIIANLPYLSDEMMQRLSPEVQCEPLLALYGGSDGLDLIRRLIAQSVGKTQFLALELGDGQSEQVKNIMKKHGYTSCMFVKDIQGSLRILIGEYCG